MRARPLSSLQRLRHRELFAGRSGSVVSPQNIAAMDMLSTLRPICYLQAGWDVCLGFLRPRLRRCLGRELFLRTSCQTLQ